MAVLFKFGGVGGGREDDMEVEKLEEVLCFDKLEACPTFKRTYDGCFAFLILPRSLPRPSQPPREPSIVSIDTIPGGAGVGPTGAA